MMKSKRIPAYLTVYLALTLGVMTTLCLALIEGSRYGAFQLESVCIADACMDSVMAEYHRELFRRYNLLAIDLSYGTEYASRTNLEGRLAWYLDLNLQKPANYKLEKFVNTRYKDFLRMRLENANVTEYSLMTDHDGAVFRRKAAEAIRDDLGLEAMREAIEWMKLVRNYHMDSWDVEAQKRAVDEQIAAYQGKEVTGQDGESVTLDFENPTASVENQKRIGILWQVMGEAPVSGKAVINSNLVRQRRKNGNVSLGNLPLETEDALQEFAEDILFVEYLRAYFGCYDHPKEGSALDYELEYVIAGKTSDASNLNDTLLRLLALREAANATYLYSDGTKREEADLVALALSTLLGVPELQGLFQTSILLGWAYAESVHDLRVLIRGGKVPLMKTSGTWHYGLDSVLQGMWDLQGTHEEKPGLSYQDYLRILLLMGDKHEMSYRAMDVMEANLRLTAGNKAFRMDACCVGIKTRIALESAYGYRQELWEEKKY